MFFTSKKLFIKNDKNVKKFFTSLEMRENTPTLPLLINHLPGAYTELFPKNTLNLFLISYNLCTHLQYV